MKRAASRTSDLWPERLPPNAGSAPPAASVRSRWRTVLGALLLVTGIAGYLTVADDLRHTGEFFGATGVLVSGLALVVAGLRPSFRSVMALEWVPPCAAAGLLGGTAIDHAAIGACLGIGTGFLVARMRRHAPRVAETPTGRSQ